MATADYKQISAIARKRRAANIAAYYKTPTWNEADLPRNLTEFALKSGYYTNDELAIIQSEADVILEKIKTKAWTALQVAQAFCKASALAQELTNCLTEVLYAEAFERAKYLDDYLERTGKTIGPLHGLPISLKDCFITAPYPSSIGMAAYANEPLQKDTLLVTILRDLGAVFYVKTNVPTAMMMAETNNNIWGECRNALHKGLSPGGSSGGEGALIAFKASPLGVGTDIGGSIRIPAAWSYMYGLKPSFGRYPVYGGKSGIPGQEHILAVNGPMSRSLKSLQIYSEAVLSERVAPWEVVSFGGWLTKNTTQPYRFKSQLTVRAGPQSNPHPMAQGRHPAARAQVEDWHHRHRRRPHHRPPPSRESTEHDSSRAGKGRPRRLCLVGFRRPPCHRQGSSTPSSA